VDQNTSICRVFEAAIAQTGASEKWLGAVGETDFEKICLDPHSHAGYYPGAKMLSREDPVPPVRWPITRRAGIR
jgi:hypothetical protein